jgi:hypothetical protein
MHKYIGTKTVFARPMTRGDYNDYRMWTVPADENPNDPGYLVEYADGGESNHPNHYGYISWSPKDVFERSYKIADTPGQRLQLELDELNEKLTKLQGFILSDKFLYLPSSTRDALIEQRNIMREYRLVLEKRLAKEYY